jgi:hypothetical protein
MTANTMERTPLNAGEDDAARVYLRSCSSRRRSSSFGSKSGTELGAVLVPGEAK